MKVLGTKTRPSFASEGMQAEISVKQIRDVLRGVNSNLTMVLTEEGDSCAVHFEDEAGQIVEV